MAILGNGSFISSAVNFRIPHGSFVKIGVPHTQINVKVCAFINGCGPLWQALDYTDRKCVFCGIVPRQMLYTQLI